MSRSSLAAPLALSLLTTSALAQSTPRRDASVLAVERVAPAVAHLATPSTPPTDDPYARRRHDWFQQRTDSPPFTSLGSGVVIDPDGFILTNAHVVQHTPQLVVRLPGHDPLVATVLALSPDDDLALLKVDAPSPLPAAEFADDDDVFVGETCLALGNPFGLEGTVTRGVVSARGRRLLRDGHLLPGTFLQTDAAIHPGNSGGPLLNLDGRVIGINSAIHPDAHGVGFAIPVARLRRALRELSHPTRIHDLELGLQLDDAPDAAGALVAHVSSGSPAAAAGLSPGDRIIAAGPHPVTRAFDVHKAFLQDPPPPTLRLAVLGHDGSRKGALLEPRRPPLAQHLHTRTGLWLRALTPALAARHHPARGLLITAVDPDSSAAQTGLQPGDLLLDLGRPTPGRRPRVFPTHDLEQLRDALDALGPGPVVVTIRRSGRDYWGELDFP